MASIQSIYLAFFGRPADPLGLAYWEEQTNDGADLSVMLDALSGTEEYQDRFVGMSNEEVIQSIYQALFGRDAEPDGLAHFLEALENGTQTLGSIAVNILDGAQGSDLAMIENKVAAADIFTASLDTPEEIEAYSGNEAADFGRQFLSTVTEDPETVPTTETVQEQIDNDLPDYTPPGAGAPGGGGGGGGNPPPPLDEAVVAINSADAVEEVLAALEEYESKLFDTDTLALFDEMPAGAGRQQAVALGIQEHIDLFGSFTSVSDVKEAVTLFTNTEHGKFEFINAVRGANDQNSMIEALDLAERLSEDRDALIEAWGSSSSADAQERAAELEADSYTIELREAAAADGMKLQYIADQLLASSDPFYGVNAIIGVIESATAELDGLTFTEASESVEQVYSASVDLSDYLAPIIDDGRLTGDEFNDVVNLAGSVEDAFRLIWDHADNQYTAGGPAGGYYVEALNSFNVDVGIRYIDYLLAGGEILDDIVKFSATREQPMHHNILANLDEHTIVDRFSAVRPGDDVDFTPEQIFARIAAGGGEEGPDYGRFIGDLGDYNDGRPVFSGSGSPDDSNTWDDDFFGWNPA